MKLIIVPNLPAKKKVLLILAENSPKQKVNFFGCTISRENQSPIYFVRYCGLSPEIFVTF